MTEIDTSRERVQMLSNLSAALSKEMDGWTSIGSDRENRVIRSNSDMLEETGLVLRALLDRAEKAEAERDKAWNAAIEAAVNAVNGCDRISEAQPAIRALRKGDGQ